MSKMNWKKLKDFECPKCSSMLKTAGEMHDCSSDDCDFRITDSRLGSVIRDMEKPIYQEPDRSNWD